MQCHLWGSDDISVLRHEEKNQGWPMHSVLQLTAYVTPVHLNMVV